MTATAYKALLAAPTALRLRANELDRLALHDDARELREEAAALDALIRHGADAIRAVLAFDRDHADTIAAEALAQEARAAERRQRRETIFDPAVTP